MKFLNKFLRDETGIILPGIIAITFIVLSSVIWLIMALVVNRTFDCLQPLYIGADPRALATSQSAVNAFGVSIVLVDIAFLVWWALSAQKYGSFEEEVPGTW